ncbi:MULTISPECIES: myo-inosose-2 dehydratase [unclassified Ruegeria]|uniref:myo-inosose-2 dehydratase n=1 Tax=unclassified Ruegeria TaxID=2625375 RepID=UPI00148A062E|nr:MULTISPECIES: myo-inosose-2 dehydratase [unclassified Ruegeria]NOD36793.1 myo-inosose-2 dehydratase [Ruegeria sp. HKCCD7296]NOD47848.1 myo-inosose-2 dehydratase [Ruegeria sp. HKCCD5849]NOD52832.1 myo-inosose-2 dehydratase [Ruegeria sp. HKCCD5851]NOD68978.1 myo-inosose-2 dehydratase [Ruegeria sp. HKCCD7303]NOE35325.1 myo-inosose-2 dehydratase [Ruegeria sp. HKCCD7318]
MSVKIGISPIAWQNDDLPDLTAAYTMEQALKEAREIGYTGVERGQRMPGDTEGLRAYLDANDIALCGGWCSGATLVNDFDAEVAAVREQVEQFVALNSPCIVYAECSNTVQGQIGTPVNARPRLSKDEVLAYAAKLSELAKWTADQGMPMAYHHHMGTIIESEDEVNWLMEGSGPELKLCFDTGHLLFGGGDVMATLNRWGDRVHHVHFKDIRPDVVQDTRENNRSFLDAVIAGAFTVPGDGCIDFQAVANALKAMDYNGWIVVEAEQDPAKAPPYEYSKMGYDHIVEVCGKAGLEISA